MILFIYTTTVPQCEGKPVTPIKEAKLSHARDIDLKTVVQSLQSRKVTVK